MPILRSIINVSSRLGKRNGFAAAQLLGPIAEHVNAIIWTTDRRLRFTSAFGRPIPEIGFNPHRIIGLSLLECFRNTEPDSLPIAAHRAALEGAPQSYEFRAGDRLFDCHLSPLRSQSGAVQGVLGLAVDITERELAERTRLATEQRYRELIEEAPDVIFALDLNGNLISLNKAAERITGYRRHELLGRNIASLLEPEAARQVTERIQRALGGETSAEFELPIRTKSGQRLILEVSARLQFTHGRPSGIQGIGRDVTERKRLEAELRERQRMEAVAELAGGLAHEFNNLLTAILGYADLLVSQSAPGEFVHEAAEVIQRAAERAQQLSTRLLGFARRGKQQNLLLDLHELVREVKALLDDTLPKNITVLLRTEAPNSIVKGDPGQLHQAFIDLALYARDSMPKGGTLTFHTEGVTLDAETFRKLGAAAPGPHIKISVSDSGEGIPAEILPHLFKPLLLAKEQQGTAGLGLAVVYGIVKNHGGAIQVSSGPGSGTTFEIYLPLAKEDLAKQAQPLHAAPRAGSGAILIIDDEMVVGQTLVRLLERLGYTAIAVCEPEQAVEAFRCDPQAFDLVILDVVMPGLGGEQCFRRLRAIRPDTPIILTSGYAQDETTRRLLEAGASRFLPKPFHLAQLAEAISRILG